MYKFIKIRHDIIKQYNGNYKEMKIMKPYSLLPRDVPMTEPSSREGCPYG